MGPKSRVAAGAAAALSLAAGAAFLFLPRSRVVYTDGGAIRRSESEARSSLRQVLWEEPERLPAEIDDPAGDSYEPRVSPEGDLLVFTRGRPGENADLWVSRRVGRRWGPPGKLEAVNSQEDELSASFTPDSAILLFASNRPGGQGGFDLWMSAREGDRFLPPRNLGPAVNGPADELSPSAGPGGRLYFASNRREGGGAPWRGTVREALRSLDYDIYTAPPAAA